MPREVVSAVPILIAGLAGAPGVHLSSISLTSIPARSRASFAVVASLEYLLTSTVIICVSVPPDKTKRPPFSISSAKALALIDPYLKDPQLQAEAVLATVQIANRVRETDPKRAKTALKNVLAVSKDKRLRHRAQGIINHIEQYEDHILVWQVAGPFLKKGKTARDVFDAAYAPEKPDADVKWKRLTKGLRVWNVDLEATFGAKDRCAAYLRTRVWSPAEQDARLEMGSDDAIKAWVGGKLVHAKYAGRGLRIRNDVVKVKLRQGWNDLLLKVVDNSGQWEFCCRVRKPDGSAIEGLKIKTP